MANQIIPKSLEFKYSVGKLLIRIIAGVLITIPGGVCYVLYRQYKEEQLHSQGIYYYNFRQLDIWQLMIALVVVAGLTLVFLSFWRMILNKRIYLKLDSTGLHYKDIELRSRLLGIFIPRNSGSSISWDSIKSICLKHGVLAGSKIEITLKIKKNGNDIRHNIIIACSQDSAENILELLRLFSDCGIQNNQGGGHFA